MKRNIALAYLITVCRNSWFWLGIWVFFYLRFTNYAGIGILETVLIIVMVTTEIPTGALADLLGKKKTLLAALLLLSLGGGLMAGAHRFWQLVISVAFSGVGVSLYSGTMEALIFDSLKQAGQEEDYDRVIARITTIQLVSWALFGSLGGFLYVFWFRLPFYLNALFSGLGLIFGLFLTEPAIDTDTFSLKTYWHQTKQGFGHLFAGKELGRQTILLLSIGVIVVIVDEMLNSFLGYEFGLSEQAIGILWGMIYLVAAGASLLTPWLKRWWGVRATLLGVGLLMGLSLIISPWVGVVAGSVTLLLRSSLQSIYENMTSVAINQQTPSRYRAVTLSSFSMLKQIPYLATAFLFGSLSDLISAKQSALWLGLVLLGLLGVQLMVSARNRRVVLAKA